jgi:hypothetical protein
MVQNVHFSRYFVKSSGSADTREMHEIGISGCADSTVHISVFRGAQCTIAHFAKCAHLCTPEHAI